MKISLQEKIYKALAHEKRLELLHLLKLNKYLTVGQCAKTLSISIQRASQHLKILESAHIIESSQEGLHVFYGIRKPMYPIIKSIISFL